MSENKTYSKTQRIMALVAVILLASLSIAALVCALLPIEGAGKLSFAFLFAAVFLPILLWIWIWLYGKTTGKRTIASIKASKEDDLNDILPESNCTEADESISDSNCSDGNASDCNE